MQGPGTQKQPSQVIAWVPHQPHALDCVTSWVHSGDSAAQATFCSQAHAALQTHLEPVQLTAVVLVAPVSQRRVMVVPGVQPSPERQLSMGGHRLQVPGSQV